MLKKRWKVDKRKPHVTLVKMAKTSKLPHSESAIIPKRKLADYLLSEKHPVGKSKAKFFYKIGFNKTNIDLLEKEFIAVAQTCNVETILNTQYGKNYVIKGSITTPSGSMVKLITVWFTRKGTNSPSFVTAYPV